MRYISLFNDNFLLFVPLIFADLLLCKTRRNHLTKGKIFANHTNIRTLDTTKFGNVQTCWLKKHDSMEFTINLCCLCVPFPLWFNDFIWTFDCMTTISNTMENNNIYLVQSPSPIHLKNVNREKKEPSASHKSKNVPKLPALCYLQLERNFYDLFFSVNPFLE